MIQIREEKKRIAVEDVLSYLEISPEEMHKMVDDGIFSSAILDGNFYPVELINGLNKMQKVKDNMHVEDVTYWKELEECSLSIIGHGVFLLGSDVTDSVDKEMLSMVEKYGVWRAQGLNNHIHLADITSNKISQIILSYDLIDIWVKNISKINSDDKFIIYLNGETETTLCIYRLGDKNEDDLKAYDLELKIKECKVYEL